MKFFKYFCVTLLLASILPYTIYADIRPIKNGTVQLADSQITPRPRLIEKDGVAWVALSSLRKIMDFEIQQERKHNRYKITYKDPAQSARILPYSREAWIGSRQVFFTEAPFVYQNSLYVQFTEFAKFSGYHLKKEDARFTLTKQAGSSTQLSAATETGILLNSTGTEKIIMTEELHIPSLDDESALFLSFGSNVYDLTEQFFYENNILFLNLKTPFEKEGFEFSETETEVSLKKNDRIIQFNKENIIVTVKDKYGSKQQNIEHALIQRKGNLYFPFKSTLNILDLKTDWSAKNRILTVLNKIKRINITQISGKQIQLDVISAYPLEDPEIEPYSRGSGYKIFIPNSQSVVAKALRPDHPFLKKIVAKNKSGNEVELFIDTALNAPYPSIEKTTAGYAISFHTYTKEIKQENDKIQIIGAGPLTYKFSTNSTKQQVIIDIPNTISGLPLFIKTENPKLYSDIRTSQFKTNPPTTRVVLDLQNDARVSTHNVQGNIITLSLPESVQRTAIFAPKRKGSKGLKGKVIAIDAGHGGRDPGAITRSHKYEKEYTLDIAKRLAKRLSDNGAYVVMSRTDDTTTHLSKRARIANQNKADILVSVHINSFVNGKANGTETYYYKAIDRELAQTLQKEMVKKTRRRNLGIKRNKLYVLSHSEMPAALVEPVFITNKSEFKLLQRTTYRQEIADGIYKGIEEYFSK